MSYQELFDKACNGVIEQGCQSIHNGCGSTSCAYRGSNGKKCAVGHLLTDEQIAKFQVEEGDTPSQFQRSLIQELAPGCDEDDVILFLEALQGSHDNVSNNDNFVKGFKVHANNIAVRWGLKGCE